MPARTAEVYLGDGTTLVGTAFFNGAASRLRTTFTYSTSWLRSEGAFALAPSAPLTAPSLHCSGLPGFLADAAPDRWGRHLIFRGAQEEALAAGAAMRTLDDVDYLMGVDDWARMGALRLSVDGGKTFVGQGTNIPCIVALPELMDAARGVDAGSAGWESVKSLLDAGSSSLGGARPKATVRDGDALWLAKFPSPRDEWEVMAWEAWSLEVARRCGFVAPPARLERVGEQPVLLSRRFDRSGDERVPYLSALAALDLADGAEADYLDLADVLQTISADVDADLCELFGRMVLSVALHNTDDHLRNHGFLRTARGWRLSPLFDVNPNPFEGEGRALPVMGAASVADEVEGLAEFADAVGLSRVRAGAVVRRVLAAVGQGQAAARRLGCPLREFALFAPVIAGRCDALHDRF